MAKRNYTEEAYELIWQTIEQIDKTDICPVFDFFGDVLQRLLLWMEIDVVENYEKNMQTWYKKVLDSHNSTMQNVKRIFKDVQNVDFEYRDDMDNALKSIASFRGVLNTLQDVISRKTSLKDGEAAANRFLTDGKNKLNTEYKKILFQKERTLRIEAGKELIGDLLKLGGSFFKLLKPMDPLEKIVEYKKFADGITATLCDLGALVSSALLVPIIGGIGLACGMDYGNYLDFRYNQLIENQEYKDTNTVSDWLGGISENLTEDLEECPKDNPYYPVVEKATKGGQIVSKGSEVVDVAVDLYDILSGLKDTHDNIDEWVNGKSYTVDEYMKVFADESPWKATYYIDGDNGPMVKVENSPDTIISTLFSDRTGIPLSGWTDPQKAPSNTFKTLGTLWSYAAKLTTDPESGFLNDDGVWNVGFSKFKETKFIKDVYDFAKDMDTLISPETEVNITVDGVGGSTTVTGGARGGSGSVGAR